MKLSVYIKKHLISDMIVLLTVSGTIFLLVSMWNNYTLETVPTVEMAPFNNNTDEILG